MNACDPFPIKKSDIHDSCVPKKHCKSFAFKGFLLGSFIYIV